jgi:hypothetical protein
MQLWDLHLSKIAASMDFENLKYVKHKLKS